MTYIYIYIIICFPSLYVDNASTCHPHQICGRQSQHILKQIRRYQYHLGPFCNSFWVTKMNCTSTDDTFTAETIIGCPRHSCEGSSLTNSTSCQIQNSITVNNRPAFRIKMTIAEPTWVVLESHLLWSHRGEYLFLDGSWVAVIGIGGEFHLGIWVVV